MKKSIALLLALVMVLGLAACGSKPAETTAPATEAATEAPTEAATEATEAETEAPAEETAVMTHDEYIAAELDSPVCIETYVQAHQSWWDGKITVYAQSEDGAYFLYNMTCSEEDAAKLEPGTKIHVDGFKSEWSGEVEIVDATFEIIEGSFVAEAEDLSGLLGAEDLVAHQNELVTFKGLTVAASELNGEEKAFLYNWDGSGEAGNNNDLYINLTDGTTTVTFTVESYLCGEGTDVYTAVTELNVGDVVDVTGFLYWYNGAQMHITSVSAAA